MALHGGTNVLFCAARVRMLGTERFGEMRERLARGAAGSEGGNALVFSSLVLVVPC